MPNHQLLNMTLYYVNKEIHLAIVNGKFSYTDYDCDNETIYTYFEINGYEFTVKSLDGCYSVETDCIDDKSSKFMNEISKYFYFTRKNMTADEYFQFIRQLPSEQLPVPFIRYIPQPSFFCPYILEVDNN